MHVTLLNALPHDAGATRAWLHDGLLSLGHQVDLADRPDLAAPDAAALGYALADALDGSTPDAVIALGWVAGLAAQVATREHPAPVILRLARPGRSGDPAVTRVERALARSGPTVLAAPRPMPRRWRLGAPRSRVRVLPEAVDAPARRGRGRATARGRGRRGRSPADVAAVLAGWRPAGRPWSSTAASSRTSSRTGSPASSSRPTATCGLRRALRPTRCARAMGMAAADRARRASTPPWSSRCSAASSTRCSPGHPVRLSGRPPAQVGGPRAVKAGGRDADDVREARASGRTRRAKDAHATPARPRRAGRCRGAARARTGGVSPADEPATARPRQDAGRPRRRRPGRAGRRAGRGARRAGRVVGGHGPRGTPTCGSPTGRCPGARPPSRAPGSCWPRPSAGRPRPHGAVARPRSS